PPPPPPYPLSLHDALPISGREHPLGVAVLALAPDVVHDRVRTIFLERTADATRDVVERIVPAHALPATLAPRTGAVQRIEDAVRSEEHTSELQSPCNLVCR